MNIYIDEKVTVWRRTYYTVDQQQLADAIKNGNVEDYINKNDCRDSEFLFETEEGIMPIENNNQPTMELFDEEGVELYNNKL